MTLTCCVCGDGAPAKAQWWNRDHGYGLCGRCAEWLKGRPDYNAEEFRSYYGDAGVHWMPLVPTCSTCGAAIDETQARVSQLRADGARPRCKDCITAELTQRAHAADDPHCTCNDCIDDHRRALISDAAQAVEEIDPDELERYAADRKRQP